MNTSNREVSIRNQIEAKQADNKNVYDSVWKEISQVAQVTDAQKEVILQLIIGYAKARAEATSSKSGTGSMVDVDVNRVQEIVPTMDVSAFKQLMNVISAGRAKFERVQREILDLSRAHNDCLTLFPSSLVCGSRPKIKIELVTSTRTDNAFATGKDDDVNVFQNKASSAGQSVENSR
jgi:hypothetical protein